MSNHHTRRAFELLAQLPSSPHQLDGLELGSAATAHALLGIRQQLAELTEQLRIANVISAFGTDSEDGLLHPDDQAAAEVYVSGAISYILHRDPEKARP